MLEMVIGSVVTGIGIGIGAVIAASVVHLISGAKYDSERRHKELVELMEDRNEEAFRANQLRVSIREELTGIRTK